MRVCVALHCRTCARLLVQALGMCGNVVDIVVSVAGPLLASLAFGLVAFVTFVYFTEVVPVLYISMGQRAHGMRMRASERAKQTRDRAHRRRAAMALGRVWCAVSVRVAASSKLWRAVVGQALHGRR